MEVSNEIKEDIRKTQTDLKNAIRVHQVWVSRLHEDENNVLFKTKVKEAENEIIAIGHAQKLVVDRLRRELELYQQCLKSRNKQINMDNDNQYVAQQLRDHQLQYNGKNRKISLLKPSVLTEIHIKTENHNDAIKGSISDSENELKSSLEKDNSNNSESDEKEKYHRNFAQYHNSVQDSRSNFVNALKKVKETLVKDHSEWHEPRSDTDSSNAEQSPSPSPPPLEPVSQETFMMLLGLVTPYHKELLERKIEERRKRASENKPDFVYANYEMMPKRKKYNQFSYLQSNNDPPQTRSAKLRKQLSSQNKSSREGSPSGSSTENKAGWSNNKPAWVASLPPSLSVEPVYPSTKKVCHGCGRNDVPSLLVWCAGCNIWMHTGCGAEGRCGACRTPLPDPAHLPPAHRPEQLLDDSLYRNKLAERKSLQERNIKLCVELRKLETRAATLKANLDEHNAEKRQLLADQINTQRNLQKLLDFISQFKETSISMRSTSASDSSSEVSKSNEE
ncbi:uncharacterized protein LOC101743404 [Bombyx mori]|uniref:Uncharacterized protein n=1 Tax=Bombyx mori TaxID=7091 RepID=A0A8R2G952_BOMMO|nr:uncharacterized protein LOC101743404 isoform X1 [Bombyx mori]